MEQIQTPDLERLLAGNPDKHQTGENNAECDDYPDKSVYMVGLEPTRGGTLLLFVHKSFLLPKWALIEFGLLRGEP